MSKVVAVYHSFSGVTEKMVTALKEGVEKAGGQCELVKAQEAKPEDLLGADTIVLASGQPFGGIAGSLKTFLEKCWTFEQKEKFAGKKYATIINGAMDASDVSAYLDNILPYFKLEKAAEGIVFLAEGFSDETLDKSKELGKSLV